MAAPGLERPREAPAAKEDAGEGTLRAVAVRSPWLLHDARRHVPGAWRPEASGSAELDVNADVVRQSTHEKVRLVLWRELQCVAHHGVEELLIILDDAVPGKPHQLQKAIGVDGWTKALVDEILEALL